MKIVSPEVILKSKWQFPGIFLVRADLGVGLKPQAAWSLDDTT
jgi:hypothetical protein